MARTSSETGTPVTLVVIPTRTTPGTDQPPHRKPIPHTGFDLVAALLVGVLLLVVGTVLTTCVRRQPHC